MHLPRFWEGGAPEQLPPATFCTHPLTLCGTSAHMLHTLSFTIRKRPRATLIPTTRPSKFFQNRRRGPQDAQDGNKTAPRRPKTAPRLSQDAPRPPQDAPRPLQDRPKTHFSSPVNPYSTPPADSEDQNSNSPGVGGMSEATK